MQETGAETATVPDLEPFERTETPTKPAIAEPEATPAPPVPKAQKPAPVVIAPKKRVRFRPSQKKKLSVAVLCTNPMTRRFI